MDASQQIGQSRVAEIRAWIAELISYKEAAAMFGVKEHTLAASPRYRHLRRVRIGQRKFFHLAEVLSLLDDEPGR